MHRAIAALLAVLGLVPVLASARILHTDSRWILDENNERYKLRCANWAGHMETNTPEGLQHQPVARIAAWVAAAGFNCVRLTYSIDMALAPGVPVSDSFVEAGEVSGAGVGALKALYGRAVHQNPFLASASRIEAFSQVIAALGAAGVDVVLDNHVSKAVWCCNLTDGNGWWDEAEGYNALTSRYFNTSDWLDGLGAMAAFAAGHANVVGMSVRNELRSLPPQNLNGEADWYNFVGQAAGRIHAANPDLLVMVGGTNGALDLSFLRTIKPLDRAPFGAKVVWEYHIYSYSPGYITSNCALFQAEMGAAAGFALQQGQPYTGPLWLSEFGVGMTGGAHAGGLNDQDFAYMTCLAQWLQGNDADWAVWALQGDYYVREGRAGYNEFYGLLNRNWSAWRNPRFPSLLGSMWNITQLP